jgi:hypothetical protein
MINPMAKVGSIEAFRSKRSEELGLVYEKFECQCADCRITKRIIKGGSVQYVYQCVRCGEPKGSAIKQMDAMRLSGGNEPSIFDLKLMDAYRNAKLLAVSKVKQKYSDSVWWDMYDAYLRSPEWKNKRDAVLRKSPLCEGCAKHMASQVHHKTYCHVGDEFLWELVAICKPCHERLHDHRPLHEVAHD